MVASQGAPIVTFIDWDSPEGVIRVYVIRKEMVNNLRKNHIHHSFDCKPRREP